MIRPYQHPDLDALLDVWQQASRIAHPFLDEAFQRQERQNIAAIYIPMAETWVYERDGDVVGFIALIGQEVGALFVMPAAQGKGIGRALVDHACTLRPALEVEVFEANPIGRRFYDRYGFSRMTAYVHEPTGQPMLRLRLDSSAAHDAP